MSKGLPFFAEKVKLFVNHEQMTKCLAKGLCQIADSLPKIQFAATLYPTERMKQAVSELYAHIVRFLIRAQDWYEENKLLHAFHSFTRPVELRYADIIEEVEACTQSVYGLATAGAQAEQRDIHLELQEVRKTQNESVSFFVEMRQLMISMWKTCFYVWTTHCRI